MPWSQPASANPRQLLVQLLGGRPGKLTRVHLPAFVLSSSFLFSHPGLLVIRPGLDLVVPHHEVVVVRGATLRVRPATLGGRAATVGILLFPLRFLLPLLHPSRCCTPSRSSSRSGSDECCPVGSTVRSFNRSGNGISAWINNMMYSNLSKGYPTFTHFPAEDQEMWSTVDQTRSRSRRASPRGRSGTGSHSHGSSSHSRGSSSHCRDSSFPAPVFAPVAAPPPAPPVVPGVMTVAQLVQQPDREHLSYLTPFNRSGNGISACINNMMYSNLSKGYPSFTHFPAEDKEMWFCQFAADENNGEPVDDFVLMKTAHTNKRTGDIDDGVVRDVLSLIETQKEDEETRLSQLQTDLDATSTASTNLSRIRINEIVESSVPKKKGRLVGLGRRARSVPPSAPQPYVDPEVLMDQLKDKDDRIAALEQKMADQEAGWEATRKQNEQMMEMMKRMYPNEQFP
ncbi:hypothetical protein F2Q70_00040509 [Brassica cretica]|uniref:Uncharacterized protein n=1 Tax=Brassica cretica TaxID=69181 RepID=A0A8S9K3W4_BRACR|nr:hypothetical protein F2Q70_00040509 [Brassica cretica]